MDVARAPLDRVNQHPVDQLDHRRVFHLRLGGRLLFPLLHDLDVLARRLHVLEDRLQLLVVRLLVVLLDQAAEGVFAGDDGEEIEAGDELEVFQQAQVAGVGHGDGEGAAFPLKGKHHALAGHVGGNQLEDLGVYLEARQVHRRHAVLPGEDLGDFQHSPGGACWPSALPGPEPAARARAALHEAGPLRDGRHHRPLRSPWFDGLWMD